jgi:hypothetical protein
MVITWIIHETNMKKILCKSNAMQEHGALQFLVGSVL